jgi:hypothetical protein
MNRNIFKFINYENYIILGNGSYDNGIQDDKELLGTNYGIMPGFSFATPHISINDDILLGVGHIKIHSDEKYKYIPDSNIDIFRRNLYIQMKKRFGSRYIRHLGTGNCEGYIYMLYFYIILNYKTENYQMKLSDGPRPPPSLPGQDLPIYNGSKYPDSIYDLNYKFSLIFPTGLERTNDTTIVVTCGEGDFYATALTFDLNQVINSCYYDIKNLDLRQYTYNIIDV